MVRNLNNLLREPPKPESYWKKGGMKKWKSLTPLTVDKIISYSRKAGILFDIYDTSIKTDLNMMVHEGSYYYTGQLKNGKAHGIIKSMYEDGCINEALWINHKRHGYGRFIWNNGHV